MAATFKNVAAQALELSDAERGELASLLMRSLEPDDVETIDGTAWEAAWATELDRRIDEVRAGTGELVDGDEVLAELSEIADRS